MIRIEVLSVAFGQLLLLLARQLRRQRSGN